MSKPLVLIVDDEWNMRNLLRIYLLQEGCLIREARTGSEALGLLEQHEFDLVLLDVMMPDMDGWQVLRAIRAVRQIPVMMLTARTDTKDKVHGLDAGADDYLTKPFEPEELAARVRSLLRRAAAPRSLPVEDALSFPSLRIYPLSREVQIREQTVDFTLKEFDLLLTLARGQRVYTREELVGRLWGGDYEGDNRVVDTHIKNIREKLQRAGLEYNPVQTVWGLGYKFQITGGADEA
ncbi:response regulator transcription factor [Paenibacillus tengchongensis]|uniref:response regulator transcription factor n=1 Tax=Paenibacillus tengchongensis TaxID=2608684 RepID=UPI001652B2F8|nr:response regulator transcription factor [Paenibacillus tengchongensis]